MNHPDVAESAAESARALICAEIAALASEFGSDLKAIVLTGSTARREQTSLHEMDIVRLLSDIEGFLVFTDSEFPRQLERVKHLAQKLEEKLEHQKILCRLDINAVPESFLRSLKPNIFSYELATHGDVIWGDRSILCSIPSFPAADIPLEDAWRLLANRIVEQMETLTSSDTPSENHTYYRTIKLVLAMANSLLIFRGRYRATYAERALAVQGLDADSETDFPFPMREFADLVSQCTGWKLNPKTAPFKNEKELWNQAVEFARRLWSWELARLTGGTPGDDPDLLYSRWMKMQSLRAGLRGWAYVWRNQGWLKSWRMWPRWMVLATEGSPRYWVYRAASEHLFAVGRSANALEQNPRLLSWLPVARPERCSSDVDSPACQILWNYKAFLERTRA